MNLAHVHLVLNHIPVVGIPVALTFFIYGLWSRNQPTQKFALWVLFALSVVVLPVYLTGDPAEDVVEHLPGVAESIIETHEDAAQISLILTLLTGAVAFVAIWSQARLHNFEDKRKLVNAAVIGISCLALGSLIYTANLGGKVRHTELRSATELRSDAQATGAEHSEQNEAGDDD